MNPEQSPPPQRTRLETVFGIIGAVLYVAVGWLYLVSGLVVPSPWLFGLWALWLAGWFAVVRIYRTRPAWTGAVAVAAAAAWALILYVGDTLLGWTA